MEVAVPGSCLIGFPSFEMFLESRFVGGLKQVMVVTKDLIFACYPTWEVIGCPFAMCPNTTRNHWFTYDLGVVFGLWFATHPVRFQRFIG